MTTRKPGGVRDTCVKCEKSVRAVDPDSWSTLTTELQVLTAGPGGVWWVHGGGVTRCPEGGTHNPANH